MKPYEDLTPEAIVAENERRRREADRTVSRAEGGDGADNFEVWARERVKIKPKGGGKSIPFVLNRPQRRLVAELEKMRKSDQPIRLILLKARQWGGRT